eukprot:TRINITY_DN5606_c0_g1_i1.p1 TRINITY_DN5606_c0_g1~~TRINITY_DN5606_c0_g1_i1.p1  ORF type:complete len:260 (+),score=46.92 TRINITY_DN5606_c0_g1_i1:131-910(+)
MASLLRSIARKMVTVGQIKLSRRVPEQALFSRALQGISLMPNKDVPRCRDNLSGVPTAAAPLVMKRFMSSVPGQEEAENKAPVSFFERMKSVFKREAKTEDPEDSFDMNNFLKQLRDAQRLGSLASFGRGLPRGGEKVVAQSLKQQEAIVLAMNDEERADPNSLTAEGKARVAKACGCKVVDVDILLQKYDWMKRASRKMVALKKEGKPIPKTMEEVEALMGEKWVPSQRPSDGSPPSRNGPCPCGSGKRYKRCCGAGT